MDSIVQSTRVVISCAGPFLKHGIPVVDSCAENGTSYVDITGETPFVRRNKDELDERAKQSGSLIVSMCGFDSLPSDLGTLYTANMIHGRFGERTASVEMFATMDGSFSGGTVETGLIMEEDPVLWAQVQDPYLLGGMPSSGPSALDDDVSGYGFNEQAGGWTAPFMMGKLNTRIVRWSASLTPHYFTDDFHYQEYMLLPNEKLAKALSRPPPPPEKRRQMIEQGQLPKQGQGPSPEKRSKSFFHMKFIGTSESGKQLITSVSGGDPGYTETSKMISEAAVCMVTDKQSMNAMCGVLPPAFAFGNVLITKLQDAGIRFAEEPLITSKL